MSTAPQNIQISAPPSVNVSSAPSSIAPATAVLSATPEVQFVSHSPLLYWWPVWLVGYLMGIVTYFRGGDVDLSQIRTEPLQPTAWPGLVFVLVLLLVILFTNVKMKGIYSVTLALAVGFIFLLLAYLGWSERLLQIIPALSVEMNLGFYLIFSTSLLLLWLVMIFGFDRMLWYRIRPGQMTEERLIGSAQRNFDAQGMLLEQQPQDAFRHVILGLGAGDLIVKTSGAHAEQIYIPNVLFIGRKLRAAERLIAMRPNH